MSDTDAALIALAERRVQMATEIVARQRTLLASFTMSGHTVRRQADLLRLFEDNLAIFERHLALVREPRPELTPPRC